MAEAEAEEKEEDVCTICSDVLVTVAFGSCLHRLFCSTCAARVRCIRGDLKCQMCRHHCDFIFVTEAQGDLTSRNNDFPLFPLNPAEGLVHDTWWYNEDSRAFFHSEDEYTKIRNLCRLSCTKPTCGVANFGCIGELMTHLLANHQLYLCTVCLVWAMRFVSEQTLFTRTELNQHIRAVHSYCERCPNPFYGDKQIFVHMPFNICPCHICDGLRPGSETSHLEDHFFQIIHIRANDPYWFSSFPIICAFDNEEMCERHDRLWHEGQPKQRQYGWRSWRA